MSRDAFTAAQYNTMYTNQLVYRLCSSRMHNMKRQKHLKCADTSIRLMDFLILKTSKSK